MKSPFHTLSKDLQLGSWRNGEYQHEVRELFCYLCERHLPLADLQTPKKRCLHMVNMGLCVSANILSEDAICIEHVAAQGESLWIPGSTEVTGTQTTSKKAPS